MNPIIKASLLAALGLCGVAAQAQSAGTLLFKAGINKVTPKVSSGELSAPSLPDTRIDVKSDVSGILTATYMLTDNVSAEFYAGLPYEHEIVGAGSIAGVGKIGSVKQVAPTLFAQYRLGAASAMFRPYAGLGLSFGHFYGEKGAASLTALTNPGGAPTRLHVEDRFGLSPQLGATVALGDKWFLDAAVIKTYLKTTSKLSTGQSIDAKMDPVSVNLSVGMRY
jgi:outer membrane protein